MGKAFLYRFFPGSSTCTTWTCSDGFSPYLAWRALQQFPGKSYVARYVACCGMAGRVRVCGVESALRGKGVLHGHRRSEAKSEKKAM